MHKEIIIIVVCLTLFLSGSLSGELKLNGPLECPVHHITVYPDRAEVSRLLTINAKEKGELSVVVGGLSTLMDHNSIRVGCGVGSATLLEVGYQARMSPAQDSASTTKLQMELEELHDRVDLVNIEFGIIDKQIGLMDTWANKQATQEQTAFDPAEHFVDYYDKKTSELQVKRTKLNKEIKKLEKRKQELENAIATLTTPSTTPSVVILLKINNPGEINLLLSYVVYLVGWSANYDVRVSSDTSSTQVTYYGSIINLSGENWNDASIALSTASPISGSPPTPLRAITVRIEEENKRLHFSSQANTVERAPAPRNLDKHVGMDTMTTLVVEGMSASHFNIPRKADIPSAESPRKVTIAILDLPCNLLYEVMPKSSSHAYLKANATNNSEYPLLAGPANVFLDNNFVSQTSLKYIPGKENFGIFLGIDRGITVERKVDSLFTETSGFLSPSTIKTYRHESIIKNTKKINISLKVYEQVPLSSNKQIKVNLLQPSIEGEDKQSGVAIDSNNILVWDVELSSGEKREFVAEYQVAYPSSLKITMF